MVPAATAAATAMPAPAATMRRTTAAAEMRAAATRPGRREVRMGDVSSATARGPHRRQSAAAGTMKRGCHATRSANGGSGNKAAVAASRRPADRTETASRADTRRCVGASRRSADCTESADRAGSSRYAGICRRALRQPRPPGRRHRGGAGGSEAPRHCRVAVGDAAAMRRVMDPVAAGVARAWGYRRIARAIDCNAAVTPVDLSPAP